MLLFRYCFVLGDYLIFSALFLNGICFILLTLISFESFVTSTYFIVLLFYTLSAILLGTSDYLLRIM